MRWGGVKWYDSSTPEESIKRVKDTDVVVVDWIDPLKFLSSMKSPSLLALMSTGYDYINLEKTREFGIKVSNIPAYSTEAVAEHTFGLLLAVARRIIQGDKIIRDDTRVESLEGIELKNRTIGIIGLGNIGRRVAEIAQGFGMSVVTYNRHPKNVLGVKDISLNELLTKSDVVCVTCPLNDNSKSMLNLKRLKLMKKDAILVGTTWGIIDIDALTYSLKNNLIRGAGLDIAVYTGKIKLPKELIRLDNVVLTPHIEWETAEAKIKQVDICISNIENYLKGKPTNIVN